MVQNLRIALLAMSLGCSFGLIAAEEEGEVIVIAELNRGEVRREIRLIEQEMYALFNTLIDDEEMRIECYEMTPTGTHRSRQVCEPAFLIQARADNANNSQFGNGIGELIPASSLAAMLKPEMEAFQELMEKTAAENNQFAQLASILSQLRARQRQLNDD